MNTGKLTEEESEITKMHTTLCEDYGSGGRLCEESQFIGFFNVWIFGAVVSRDNSILWG